MAITSASQKPAEIAQRPPNPVQLRGTQAKDKAELYKRLRQGDRRIVFVAGCGYGKTCISASVIHDITVVKKQKILFVVPAVSLVRKTLATFRHYQIKASVIHRDFKADFDETAPCQITLWQTLHHRWPLEWFAPDVVFLDEVHEVCFSKWSLRVFPPLDPSNGELYDVADLTPALKCLGADGPRSLAELEQLHARKLKYHANDEDELDRLGDAWRFLHEQQHLLPPNNPAGRREPILIGLTATPFRLSAKQQLDRIFQSQVLTPTPGELVRAGQLVGCAYFEAGCPDLTGVSTVAGDFKESELARACNTPEANAAIVAGYLAKAAPEGRPTLAFAVNVAHVEALTQAFCDRGVKAVGITGQTPTKQRETWFAQLAAGELQVIVNRDTLYRGVDIPEVSCLLLCRPTLSKVVHVQQIGRGMRLSPETEKSDCSILDYAGNIERHGKIEDLEYPPLREGGDRARRKGKRENLKECPSCQRAIDAWLTLCPHCEHDFAKPHLVPTGDLLLSLSEAEQEQYDYYRKMLAMAYQKGYNPYWAVMRVQEKFQTEAQCPKAWARHAVFGPTPSDDQIASYRRYLEAVADKMLRSKPNRGANFRGRLIGSCLLMEFGAIVGGEVPKARVELPQLSRAG